MLKTHLTTFPIQVHPPQIISGPDSIMMNHSLGHRKRFSGILILKIDEIAWDRIGNRQRLKLTETTILELSLWINAVGIYVIPVRGINDPSELSSTICDE